MRGMADGSVDSIVTDPPYELGFMGKSWDSTGIAYSVEMWTEALRVLKPGGHLLAFSGSRTYHRMACAIEDAGFQIRDQIMWLYGSGFPKSLDVSKAIDKGSGENRDRQLRFTEWMRSTGITTQQVNDATGTNMASHYLTNKQQPAIATADLFDKMRPHLPEVPEYIERLVAERTGIEWTAYTNREVVGTKMSGIANAKEGQRHTIGASKAIEVDITAPSTPAAQQWEGWGTALKPAHEPIVMARKPFAGTVASNVLQHGTGALNIDGSRIGTGTGEIKTVNYPDIRGNNYNNAEGSVEYVVKDQGRWPANVIHDGSDEVVDGFPDNGSAARFFYCAKANKRDRNEGLDGFAGKEIGGKGNGLARTCATCGASVLDGCQCPDRTFTNPTRANHHPTVKPVDLMRYLVKLITPPKGVVLDPFMGSGSTGKGAVIEGFNFVGIEQDADYLDMARARIQWAGKQEVQLGIDD
jgi:DNA modification methylase